MNRHVQGETNEIRGQVRASIAVFAGELVWRNSTADYVNSRLPGAQGTADFDVYPWMAGASNDNAVNFGEELLGVSMDDSPYGSTDTIAIATTGVFKFPLYQKGGVTLGAAVSGVSHLSRVTADNCDVDATSSSTYNYTVRVGDMIGGANPSGGTIGYCVKEESGASYVRVRLMSKYGEGRPTSGNW